MTAVTNVVKTFANIVHNKRRTVFFELAEVYKPSGLYQKKDALIGLIKEKAEIARKSEIMGKLRVAKEYFKVEMAPPTQNSEIASMVADAKLIKDFFQTGAFKYVTVKQALLLFLVGLEVSLWFFLGETIGKRHIVGYKV